MHNAPAVSYPVGRSRFHVLLIFCASLISAAALLAWAMQTDQTRFVQFGAGLFWLLSSSWAVLDWWRTPLGVLQFTGEGWHWSDPVTAQPVTLDLAFDLQHTLLLEVRGSQTRPRWLWLELRLQPPRWPHLRRAVYAVGRASGSHDKPGVLV